MGPSRRPLDGGLRRIMRVFIVGAGAVGSIIADMLAKELGKRNVRCGDRDPARARRFMPAKTCELVRVDASTPAEVAKAAQGFDLVVNAGLPDFNEKVMAAALAAKAHYQDLCSHLKDLRNAEQSRFDARFRKIGRTALFNTGVAPGLTNLLTAELARGFERRPAARIRPHEEQDADAPVWTWPPRVVGEELASPPLD